MTDKSITCNAADSVKVLPAREVYDRWASFYDTDGNPLIAQQEIRPASDPHHRKIRDHKTMKPSAESFRSDDGATLWVHCWKPSGSAQGILHIAHGLSEHSLLYDKVAPMFADHGYWVYANDHRGHGKTAGSIENLGHFADSGGWDRVVKDLELLVQWERERHPRLPVFLLGQSMGSFMAQQFLFEYGSLIDGCVLAGSTGKPEWYVHAIRATAWLQRLFFGRRRRSALLHYLSLTKANWRFRPRRTHQDWLTRDTTEVDRFIADPLCDFIGTTQLWLDIVHGMIKIAKPSNQQKISKSIFIYILAGTEDPISDRCKCLKMLAAALRRAGVTRLESRFYPGGRHEMLKETNRGEVVANLIAWMNQVVAARRAGL